MKRAPLIALLALLLLCFILQSCAPNIYGQTKRKRISNRDCGCEWYQPQEESQRALCAVNQ